MTARGAKSKCKKSKALGMGGWAIGGGVGYSRRQGIGGSGGQALMGHQLAITEKIRAQ